eukprot:7379043-Prymnesium_polylepis.3
MAILSRMLTSRLFSDASSTPAARCHSLEVAAEKGHVRGVVQPLPVRRRRAGGQQLIHDDERVRRGSMLRPPLHEEVGEPCRAHGHARTHLKGELVPVAFDIDHPIGVVLIAALDGEHFFRVANGMGALDNGRDEHAVEGRLRDGQDRAMVGPRREGLGAHVPDVEYRDARIQGGRRGNMGSHGVDEGRRDGGVDHRRVGLEVEAPADESLALR